MKRVLSLLLALVMVVCLLPTIALAADVTPDTSWYDVDGTEFVLYDVADLFGFAAIANGTAESITQDTFENKTIKLGADIDLGNMVWPQINQFGGEFDGQGHIIRNFKLVESRCEGVSKDASGFFRQLNNGAYIHDLTLYNVSAESNNTSWWGMGILAGFVVKRPNIKNVTVDTVTITATGNEVYVGGLCSRVENEWDVDVNFITDCMVRNLTVTTPENATTVTIGGFVRVPNACAIKFKNCSVENFTLNIASGTKNAIVGGFAATTQTRHSWAAFENCSVTGLDIMAAGEIDIGGFVCASGSSTSYKYCSVSGRIDATNVKNSNNCIGGFVAQSGFTGGEAKTRGGDSYISCKTDIEIVTGGAIAGGFLANTNTSDNKVDDPVACTDCSVSGSVKNATDGGIVGGFVGNADRGTYTNCTVYTSNNISFFGAENGEITEENCKVVSSAPVVLLPGIFEAASSVLDETFADVSHGAYYYNAVEWAYNKGIAGGVDSKHFAPDESCTRAQAVTMLWRTAGCPEVWAENPFVDVDVNDYYYEAVLWAVANGITSGSDETHFSPDAPCTRGQIVTFLHRAERYYDAHENFGFVDVKTGSYCEDAINWAVENAITNGTGVDTFSPDAVCTRAQIVTFLYRNR